MEGMAKECSTSLAVISRRIGVSTGMTTGGVGLQQARPGLASSSSSATM